MTFDEAHTLIRSDITSLRRGLDGGEPQPIESVLWTLLIWLQLKQYEHL